MELQEKQNPLRFGLRRDRGVEPCTVVIFGASGDLTRRKLVPALYNLGLDRLLPGSFATVGVGRKPIPGETFVAGLREGVRVHSRRALDEELWSTVSEGISWVAAREDYSGLAEHRPILAATLSLFLLALAGLPGTSGFMSRFIVMSTAIGTSTLRSRSSKSARLMPVMYSITM